MRIGRTLPPAASPLYLKDIFYGLKGLIKGSKEVDRFEFDLKAYYNVRHCSLVSSGKAALTLILRALHELHPDRNEVVIPAFTCYSVPSAIVRAGLKIKLCDIDPTTLDFDFDQLKTIITQSNSCNSKKSSILAIIPTHLFGLPADVEKVRKINFDHKIKIIEDAAQAMGGLRENRKLGTLCDVGFFSLGRGKGLSAVEGGIILTNNNSIADKIIEQKESMPAYNRLEVIKLVAFSIVLSIFMHPAFFWFPKALPFLRLGETLFEPEFQIKKMSFFQAGLTRNWQKKLNTLSKIRKKHTTLWSNSLSSNKFDSKSQILLRFPLRIENKQTLKRILLKSENRGLGIMRAYPDSINNIKELQNYFKDKSYPEATMISEKIITLPVHHFMSLAESSQIEELIHSELGA